MKKIFNRVLAAAIAVPMALTQSVVMNVSAEDTGAKVLTLDTFTAVPVEESESRWNEAALNMFISMEGTQKEIAVADFINLIPQTNMYGVMLAEILTDAANPVLTVENGVVTIAGTADLSAYAEKKIYSKIREAAGADLTLTAFNKQVDYYVTFDSSVLADQKNVDVIYSVSIGGEAIDENSAAAHFNGLADDLAAEVSAQVGVDAAIEEAMTVEIIDKLEKAEEWFDRAEALERTGSYATADEMMAAISKFVDNRVNVYSFPASVDEAVARHGNGFNAAVDLISGISASSGYVLDITADDIAELAKSGSAFEVAVSGGTYEISFTIPDDQAAEVEAYVNENAEPDENGIVWVYASSTKLVEASVTTEGVVSFNVTRDIEYADSRYTTTTTTTTTTPDPDVTTTTTTDTTVDPSSTTTTTDTTVDPSSTTTTTETSTTVSGGPDDTTTTDTSTTVSGGPDDSTTTTTTTTTIPVDFILEDIVVEAGVGYYFSHDENAFDLAKLVTNLTLVGNINGEAQSIVIAPDNYGQYLTPAFASPAALYNNVEGAAYVKNTLELAFSPLNIQVAETADLTVDAFPTVYVGVKGDANLNGKVDLDDVAMVLAYYANVGASLDASFNADADLEVLAYFLADVDTESTAGANVAGENMIDLADSNAIVTYYAYVGAGLEADWDVILDR